MKAAINNRLTNLTSTLNLSNTTSYKATKDGGVPVFLAEGKTAEEALQQSPYLLNRCIHLLTHPHAYLWAWTQDKDANVEIEITQT